MKTFFATIISFLAAVLVIALIFHLGLVCKIWVLENEELNDSINIFNSILSPLIALTAALLTYFAFMAQVETNKAQKEQFAAQDNAQKAAMKEQQKQFDEQVKAAQIDQFENRLFELIKIHRENVVHINNSQNTENLYVKHDNFRFLNISLQNAISILKNKNKSNFSNELIIRLGYLLWFDGNLYYRKLKQFGEPKNLFDEFSTDDIKTTAYLSIGNYFRHLYFTIKYIDTRDFLTDEQKYFYAKLLRVQLTNDELMILFFNSISDIGKKWKDEGLMDKYQLIKNMKPRIILKNCTINIEVKDYYPNIQFEVDEYL